MSLMHKSGHFKRSSDFLTYERLNDLTKINRQIAMNIDDLDKTLSLITQSAQTFLNVRRCGLWLLDPDCKDYVIAKGEGYKYYDFIMNVSYKYLFFSIVILLEYQ